jgi:hypothetical protein
MATANPHLRSPQTDVPTLLGNYYGKAFLICEDPRPLERLVRGWNGPRGLPGDPEQTRNGVCLKHSNNAGRLNWPGTQDGT